MKISRRAFFNIALLLASLLVSLLVSEIVVSIAAPQRTWSRLLINEPAIWRFDPTMSRSFKPGFKGSHRREEYDVRISINSDGFRGRELRAVGQGTTRILALGDSFTFGWGVNDSETWPAQVEQNLTAAGLSVEVINAGFASGYSPDFYYLFLRERLSDLRPDLVMIGFFLGNDVDGYADNIWIETDKNGLPLRIDNPTIKIDRQGYAISTRPSLAYSIPVWRDSHLMHLLGKGYRKLKNNVFPPNRGPSIFDVIYRVGTVQAVTNTKFILEHIFALTETRNIPILFVIIPTREQVVRSRIKTATLDFEKPNREFRKFFKFREIPYIDLLSKFRLTDRREELYYPLDIHWTRKGHEVAGAIISNDLLNNFEDMVSKND